CRRARIHRIVGQQEIAREVQDAEVSPVTGVKLLSVPEEVGGGGCGIGGRTEVRDVGNALFFVDDEVLDEREVFGGGLRDQMGRRIAVGASVVHVNVNVTANPARICDLR